MINFKSIAKTFGLFQKPENNLRSYFKKSNNLERIDDFFIFESIQVKKKVLREMDFLLLL